MFYRENNSVLNAMASVKPSDFYHSWLTDNPNDYDQFRKSPRDRVYVAQCFTAKVAAELLRASGRPTNNCESVDMSSEPTDGPLLGIRKLAQYRDNETKEFRSIVATATRSVRKYQREYICADCSKEYADCKCGIEMLESIAN